MFRTEPHPKLSPMKIHFHSVNYHLCAVNTKSRHSISSVSKSPLSNCLLSIFIHISHIIKFIILSTKLRTGILLPNYCPCGTYLLRVKTVTFFYFILCLNILNRQFLLNPFLPFHSTTISFTLILLNSLYCKSLMVDIPASVSPHN